MQLKKLKIKNFFSIGNKPIIIEFNNNLNYITGYNYDNNSTNGVGKTTIFVEAILFALFGKTFKLVQKDDIINLTNKKNLEIEVELFINNKNYIIKRYRKPNRLIVIEDNQEIEFSSIQITQNFINSLLGINFETFFNLLILSANKNISFIDNKGIKNKILFEKIFFNDINFKDVLDNIRKIKNTLSNKLNKLIIEQEKLKTEILTIKKGVSNNKNIILEKINKYKQNFNKINNININEIQQKQNKLKTKIEDIKFKIDKTIKNINETTNEVKIKSEYKQILLNGKDRCPICKQPLSESLKTSLILNFDKDVNQLIKYINNLKKKIDNNKLQLQKYVDKLNKIVNKLNEINYKKNQLNKLIIENEKLLKQLNIKIDITKYKQKINNTKRTIKYLNNEIEDYKILERIFDTKAGIINYFIENTLTLINKKIKDLITLIEFDYDFEFDANLNLKLNRNLFTFSSGELKMINFIVTFAIYETYIILYGNKLNILIIDEFFDSTISLNKLHLLYELLKKINNKYHIGVYLLSHKIDMKNRFEFDNIIMLEKRNGFTIIGE